MSTGDVTSLSDRRLAKDQPLDRSLFWRLGAPAKADVDVIRVEVLRSSSRGTSAALWASDSPPIALTADTAGDLAMALFELAGVIRRENSPPARQTAVADAPACPSWCALGPHDFTDRRVGEDSVLRGHRHHCAEIFSARRATGFPGETVQLYSIGLRSTEFASDNEGVPVMITVESPGASLDAADARRFAMQLMDAATKLDALDGAAVPS